MSRKKDTILILDFGSAYTQLIARRVRLNKVFSQIVPYNIPAKDILKLNSKGLILSGGENIDYVKRQPLPDKRIFQLGLPILGIAYGMRIIVSMLDGKIKANIDKRHLQYNMTEFFIDDNSNIFNQMPANITCWMDRTNYVGKLPQGFNALGHTLFTPYAAIGNQKRRIFGLHFHPEVARTEYGSQIIYNFLFKVCRCAPRWVTDFFIKDTTSALKQTIGKKSCICILDGTIQSSVTTILLHKAINRRLKSVFIDSGLLPKDETRHIKRIFRDHFHLNLSIINASQRFIKQLKSIISPLQKKKIIHEELMRILKEKIKRLKGIDFFAQGTLYSDVIESRRALRLSDSQLLINSKSDIFFRKRFKLIEPLRDLFKDEVIKIAKQLKFPDTLIYRQVFPESGLATRIIGEVTPQRLDILREIDRIVIDEIKRSGFYPQVLQSFALLWPSKTTSITDAGRHFENVCILRCLVSPDGMTIGNMRFPHEFLEKLSKRIIDEVGQVGRILYDISPSPPAKVEWE